MALRFGKLSESRRRTFYQIVHPLLGSTPAELVDIMTMIKVYLGVQTDMHTDTFTIARLYDRAKEEHQRREQERAKQNSAGRKPNRGPM